jgi:5-bromo-4-chloroindolyl phosphate hydrolysis protein
MKDLYMKPDSKMRKQIRELAETKKTTQLTEASESGALIDEIINKTLKDFQTLLAAGVVSGKDLNNFIKLTEAYTKVEHLKLKQSEIDKEVDNAEVAKVIEKFLQIQELENDKDS